MTKKGWVVDEDYMLFGQELRSAKNKEEMASSRRYRPDDSLVFVYKWIVNKLVK